VGERLLALKGSALFAAVFFAAGIGLPYFPVWLGARGLSPAEIGLVLAIPPLTRIFAAPALSALADRTGRPVDVLAACWIAGACVYAAMSVAGGLVAILLLVTLVSILTAPGSALADAMTSEAARRHAEFSYANVRIWGSVAFIAGNLIGGFALERTGPGSLVALMSAGLALGAAAIWCMRGTASFTLPRPEPAQPDVAAEPDNPSAWPLAAVIIILALLNASHAMFYGFATIAWTANGIEPWLLGPIWSAGVIAEIVLFRAVASRRWGVRAAMLALALATAIAFLRWTVSVLPLSAGWLMLLQLTHAATFGLAHMAGIALLAAFSWQGARARAQGYAVSFGGLVMALASLPCGWLYAHYGDKAYLAMNVLVAGAGLGLVCLHIMLRRGRVATS
jgi:MFS transporter, PPP family, 3-phenylpropionic acid transporter